MMPSTTMSDNQKTTTEQCSYQHVFKQTGLSGGTKYILKLSDISSNNGVDIIYFINHLRPFLIMSYKNKSFYIGFQLK